MDKIKRNVEFLTRLYTEGCDRAAWSFYPTWGPDLCGQKDYSAFPAAMDTALAERVSDYFDQCRLLEAVESDTVPCARLLTGSALFGQAFGCKINSYPQNAPFADPLVFSPEEAVKLRAPRVEDCPNLMRVLEMAGKLQRELGPEAYLAAPDLQSGFDIAHIVWDKTDILCSMIADPAAVKHLVHECAMLLKKFYALLKREFPQVSPCHWPGSWSPTDFGIWTVIDESGGINNAMFEEFCLPELIDLSQTFNGIGLHCCADAEHQFESLKKIPRFFGFNRVAAKQGYEPLLRYFGDTPTVMTLEQLQFEQIWQLLARAPRSMRWHFVGLGVSIDEAKRRRDQIDRWINRQ